MKICSMNWRITKSILTMIGIYFNIVFTNNNHPSHWKTNFNEDDALNRIFDDATVI